MCLDVTNSVVGVDNVFGACWLFHGSLAIVGLSSVISEAADPARVVRDPFNYISQGLMLVAESCYGRGGTNIFSGS